MGIYCKGCGERMTSAPDHIEHEADCVKTLLWKAIDAYVMAHRKQVKSGRVEAVTKARDEINRLIGAGRFGYGYG